MTHKKAVHQQIVIGLGVLITLCGVGWHFLPEFTNNQRHLVLSTALIVLAIPLFLSITGVVFKRYASESLIQGYQSTEKMPLAQSNLQNTLEQTIANLLPMLAFALSAPAQHLKIILIQAGCFVAGRFLFFMGYHYHPLMRLAGFVVGWYGAIIMFFLSGCLILKDFYGS